MSVSVEYCFSYFTRENYRNLIRLARERRVFENYSHLTNKGNFVLWRHDVDFSMHSACRLAKIEAEEKSLVKF